jgi:hypothetical protein
MAAISSIALIGGLAISAVGAVMQFQGQRKMQQAQERAIKAQQRAEAARQRQMELEAGRRKREIIRQGILARSQATAQAVASGAQFGSGLPGAIGGIAGQTAYAALGVDQARSIGTEIFSANQAKLSANRDEARAGGQVAMGAGISSLGGAFSKTLGSIGRLSGGA